MHTLYSDRFRSLSFSAARCDVSKKRPATAVSVNNCATHSSTWRVGAQGEAQGEPQPRAPAPRPRPRPRPSLRAPASEPQSRSPEPETPSPNL